MKVNIGCGPHRARAPWVNVDRVYLPGRIEPDMVNKSGLPADLAPDPIPYGSATHVYLGHVLEHVRWETVPDFLRSVRTLTESGGLVAVVGPDVQKVIAGHKEGRYPWSLVSACLEGSNAQIDDIEATHDGARHQWNCTEERVVEAFGLAGFVDIEPFKPRELSGEWPLVSPADWQCAVVAVAP